MFFGVGEGAVPLLQELGPHLTQYVTWAEVYLHTKFYLTRSIQPFCHIHQRHR